MKPPPFSENDEQDREIIKLLQDLGSLESEYPRELLTARRAAFVAQIEQLGGVDVKEGLDSGDEEVINLLRNLESAQVEYPANLLAARRSAFLQQIGTAETTGLLDKLRFSIKSRFQYKQKIPAVPWANLRRTSLVVAVLMIAALIGTLLFSRVEQPFNPSASQGVARPTRVLPTSTREVSIILCKPHDQAPLCSPQALDLSEDLAGQGNGAARPAVSKDARSGDGAVYQAAYVNDGRSGTSWVSSSAHSWIKIDLGKVTTINSVSLQKGGTGSSHENDPGQFVIAVALSDVYADGDSSNDYTEYAQVFDSEQTRFSGNISRAETVRTLFPSVRARYVKITFEKAGAAIEEVGVFMVQPPELAELPTENSQEDVPGVGLIPMLTNTLLPLDTETSYPTDTRRPTETLTPLPTHTGSPTDTPIPSATNSPTTTLTPSQTPTNTPRPSNTPANTLTNTPTSTPTNTRPPADTATPIPTNPLPSDTPTPSPTAVPPTAIPPTAQPLPADTGPIIVTSTDQNLTFTCNGNVVEVRGHANTVTLLGSCSSITVTGNGNLVFWQSGSPVITDKGNENIIIQR